jgi:hypothetical protein
MCQPRDRDWYVAGDPKLTAAIYSHLEAKDLLDAIARITSSDSDDSVVGM